MSFPLVKALQVVEAFLPLGGQGVPYEAERIQSLTALRRHGPFGYALNPNPLSQEKPLLAMSIWHTTMSFPMVERLECTEPFFPLCSEWVPHKAQRLQPLAALW